MTTQNQMFYNNAIATVLARIVRRSGMVAALTEIKTRKKLEVLAIRDKQHPERAGTPLPDFLTKYL